jgi:hypothetical protein
VKIHALIEWDPGVGASALLTSIQPGAWNGCSQKFAPRLVGCDHAYTVGKMSHYGI